MEYYFRSEENFQRTLYFQLKHGVIFEELIFCVKLRPSLVKRLSTFFCVFITS